jgi:hypothetical protein
MAPPRAVEPYTARNSFSHTARTTPGTAFSSATFTRYGEAETGSGIAGSTRLASMNSRSTFTEVIIIHSSGSEKSTPIPTRSR